MAKYVIKTKNNKYITKHFFDAGLGGDFDSDVTDHIGDSKIWGDYALARMDSNYINKTLLMETHVVELILTEKGEK